MLTTRPPLASGHADSFQHNTTDPADEGARSRPPRLIVRTLGAIFAGFALLVCLVGLVWLFEAQHRADRSVEDHLSRGRQAFERLLERRAQNREIVAARLTAAPSLLAALVGAGSRQGDAWSVESAARRAMPAGDAPDPAATVAAQLHDAVDAIGADAILVLDPMRRIVAAEGPNARAWVRGTVLTLPAPGDAAPRPRAIFRRDTVSLIWLYPVRAARGELAGEVVIETRLDAAYARSIALLTHTDVAVFWGGQLVASSLEGAPARDLAAMGPRVLRDGAGVTLAAERFHVGRYRDLDGVSLVALESRAAADSEHRANFWLALAPIGGGALLLGAVLSWWLARSFAKPLDELSSSAHRAVATRTFDTPLPPSRSSREVATLTGAFNSLLLSLDDAEARMRSTSVGAIRALAVALDARDPYTAGHSERVSNLAVAIGRQMGLGDDDLEVLRLGGLLHDIGKIGVADEILLKTSALTPDEEEAIREHPRTGARILKSVPFLAPHLPIVELHHERPDGLGYPHGLAGDAIPVLARIVRVADAFDAMTSARAYRRALSVADAVDELWQQAGTGFDAGVVDALLMALPSVRPGFTRELAATPHIELLRARGVLVFPLPVRKN